MKFKTRSKVVQGIEITDPSIGQPGNWIIIEDGNQRTVTNEEFVENYAPAGRGESKAAYESAKSRAGTATASV